MIVPDNQPEGTPTWIALGVPDLDRALDFYGALFGWQFDVGPRSTAATPPHTWTAAGRRAGPSTTRHRTRFWCNVLPGPGRLRPTTTRSNGHERCSTTLRRDTGPDVDRRDPAGGQFGSLAGPPAHRLERVTTQHPGPQRLVTRPAGGRAAGSTSRSSVHLDGQPGAAEFDSTFLPVPRTRDRRHLGLPAGRGRSVDHFRGRRDRTPPLLAVAAAEPPSGDYFVSAVARHRPSGGVLDHHPADLPDATAPGLPRRRAGSSRRWRCCSVSRPRSRSRRADRRTSRSGRGRVR